MSNALTYGRDLNPTEGVADESPHRQARVHISGKRLGLPMRTASVSHLQSNATRRRLSA
jgi:hypothetical protein